MTSHRVTRVSAQGRDVSHVTAAANPDMSPPQRRSTLARASPPERSRQTTPNDARYFAGLMVWRPGELEEEIREGAWRVRPASVEAVLGSDPASRHRPVTNLPL
jgi:putative AlgH/UPF0301 family transcriptional regulator